GMVAMRQRDRVIQCAGAAFEGERAPRGIGNDKMCLDLGQCPKPLDDAQRDCGTRSARYADDDPLGAHAVILSRPSDAQRASTFATIPGDMVRTRPHSRSVSLPIFVVASSPSLPPSPDLGEAKSR